MHDDKRKNEAKKLYNKGRSFYEINHELKIPQRTLRNWFKTEEEKINNKKITNEELIDTVNRKIFALVNTNNKADNECKELDILLKTKRELSRYFTDSDTAKNSTKNTKKKLRTKNDFSDIDPTKIYEKFKDGLFAYQLELWNEKKQRIRNILKSRQIGLTYYFAREAFADALITGSNQVFLSASRNQADVFRSYIKDFAREWFDGYELKGRDTIEIITPSGTATLYFLSTNSATAQTYHGNLYVDEYFWIPKFSKLNTTASAIATHDRWRKTYFSTPSSKSHSAYPFWSMDIFNNRLKKNNKAILPFPKTKELRKGILCKDAQYRKLITIYDAEKFGCNLFNIEQLKLEYSTEEFDQLFRCKFIDDSASIFKLSTLEKCLCDSAEFKDFKKDSVIPYQYPVWIGYDPSRNGDGASIVVIAVPRKINGKFRVLDRIRLHNQAWQYQAAVIKELTQKYKVEYIGIDITGPGSGVFEMVKNFFPTATPIYYTLDQKTKLVLKAQQVISDNRICWDASFSDIAAGFMQIRQMVTQSGQISYVADRTEKTGHADSAWAIMHAIINEGLLRIDEQQKTTVVFFD